MERFSRRVFDCAEDSDLVTLCRELATVVSARLDEGSDWHSAAYELVEQLRSAGHDLWSFDAGLDFQLWGGDYTNPQPGGELRLGMWSPATVEVTWRRSDTDTNPVVVQVGTLHDRGVEQGDAPDGRGMAG